MEDDEGLNLVRQHSGLLRLRTWTSFIFCSEFCFSSSRCSSCAWFRVSTSWSYTIYARAASGSSTHRWKKSSLLLLLLNVFAREISDLYSLRWVFVQNSGPPQEIAYVPSLVAGKVLLRYKENQKSTPQTRPKTNKLQTKQKSKEREDGAWPRYDRLHTTQNALRTRAP